MAASQQLRRTLQPTPAYVTFTALHYTDVNATERRLRARVCTQALCGLVQWTAQVYVVADAISQKIEQNVAIRIISDCSNALPNSALFAEAIRRTIRPQAKAGQAAGRVNVHVSGSVPHRLHDAITRLGSRPMQRTLEKWAMMRMVHSKVVVFLDMDVELFPLLGALSPAQRKRTLKPIVAEWSRLVTCAAEQQQHMLTYPDYSSPVNAAVMLLRPNASLYRDGVAALLRQSGQQFNATDGWDAVGPPLRVVPKSDDAWRRSRGSMLALDHNRWDFVGAGIDQGFFFYMLRVRHRTGGDIRLSKCAWQDRERRPRAKFWHHGAVGGWKPWDEPCGPDSTPYTKGWRIRALAITSRVVQEATLLLLDPHALSRSHGRPSDRWQPKTTEGTTRAAFAQARQEATAASLWVGTNAGASAGRGAALIATLTRLAQHLNESIQCQTRSGPTRDYSMQLYRDIGLLDAAALTPQLPYTAMPSTAREAWRSATE